MNLYAFFSSSTAALSDGAGHNIPSADFQISTMAAHLLRSPIPCPLAGPTQGCRYRLCRFWGFNKTGINHDAMTFNINLAPLPNLQAGVYTGTLTIQAQAF